MLSDPALKPLSFSLQGVYHPRHSMLCITRP